MLESLGSVPGVAVAKYSRVKGVWEASGERRALAICRQMLHDAVRIESSRKFGWAVWLSC